MNLCRRVGVQKQVDSVFLSKSMNLLGSIYFGFGEKFLCQLFVDSITPNIQ